MDEWTAIAHLLDIDARVIARLGLGPHRRGEAPDGLVIDLADGAALTDAARHEDVGGSWHLLYKCVLPLAKKNAVKRRFITCKNRPIFRREQDL